MRGAPASALPHRPSTPLPIHIAARHMALYTSVPWHGHMHELWAHYATLYSPCLLMILSIPHTPSPLYDGGADGDASASSAPSSSTARGDVITASASSCVGGAPAVAGTGLASVGCSFRNTCGGQQGGTDESEAVRRGMTQWITAALPARRPPASSSARHSRPTWPSPPSRRTCPRTTCTSQVSRHDSVDDYAVATLQHRPLRSGRAGTHPSTHADPPTHRACVVIPHARTCTARPSPSAPSAWPASA